jgi:hypothetical protein
LGAAFLRADCLADLGGVAGLGAGEALLFLRFFVD